MNLKTQKIQSVKIFKSTIFEKINSLLNKKNEDAYSQQMSENNSLIESIKDAKNKWVSANNNFEQVIESEIVDYYTYKIKAYQVRYEYLLKKAKEKGISL